MRAAQGGPPRTGFAYLDAVLCGPGGAGVLAIAHRGGAGHPDLAGFENTAHAFRHALSLGYGYLETDVHATRDGVLFALHDDDLARVTGRAAAIADLTAAEVAGIRIRGEQAVPTMAGLLEEFPAARFNIDLKSPDSVAPMADLVERTGSQSRVCVGSFSRGRIDRFRDATGGRVATAASPAEVVAFRALPTARLAGALTRHRVAVLQVPHHRGRLRVVTSAVVRRAHLAGSHVHVWTVDEPAEMHELLDLGVDGIITDRTDVLKDVLLARGLWGCQGTDHG